MSKLKKIALITGASSGIGKALAFQLSKKGYELILSSRNIELLDETANIISDLGGKAHSIQMDITNHKSVKNLFIKSKKIGFVDVVVNNAGIAKFDNIHQRLLATATDGKLRIFDYDSNLTTELLNILESLL